MGVIARWSSLAEPPDRWIDLATRGGEDYELLLTIPPNRLQELQEAMELNEITVTSIGTIAPMGQQPELRARTLDGESIIVSGGSFDHFRNS